ncbi:chromosomal replication initiator protein DnaA [Streptococcus danieliae]|uniref:Chromosomal replication initiator protein DnaA n=1 Tax=Streptococcus danieliae TaxID=747656 RepID=A0A7X3KB26_9STRE|nr:chromosomal replication initiator protein DnaA [Streptococcus danieliae]MVX58135.1 chromosomal replication initiator protein DnaA [Streptococcus danieliae]
MDKNQQFWQRFLELSQQTNDAESIQFFVDRAELVSIDGDTITVYLDNPIKQDYWENNFQENLRVAGFELYHVDFKVHYVFERPLAYQEQYRAAPQVQPQNREDTGLIRKHSFDNFVRGDGNIHALGAALAVVEAPGNTYNPLFIYGGPGLGKTHLINALGNAFFEDYPNNRVLYISAESFLNSFIESIRLANTEDFKERFRNLDLLIIDDIQSLNKDTMASTQEELFNTFETLFKKEKQIVFTSDRRPDQLNGMPERLINRFEWGLITDITPPDYETRIAILQAKTQNLPYTFPIETFEYLANQFDSNVRELEGALNDIRLVADVQGVETITVELAAQAIRSRKEDVRRITVIPIENIQEEVGKFYGISVKEIKGSSRKQHIVLARSVAMYLSRELTDNSQPKIGKAFGGKDHTTVIHAHRKIKKQIKDDQSLFLEIEEIKKNLKK